MLATLGDLSEARADRNPHPPEECAGQAISCACSRWKASSCASRKRRCTPSPEGDPAQDRRARPALHPGRHPARDHVRTAHPVGGAGSGDHRRMWSKARRGRFIPIRIKKHARNPPPDLICRRRDAASDYRRTRARPCAALGQPILRQERFHGIFKHAAPELRARAGVHVVSCARSSSLPSAPIAIDGQPGADVLTVSPLAISRTWCWRRSEPPRRIHGECAQFKCHARRHAGLGWARRSSGRWPRPPYCSRRRLKPYGHPNSVTPEPRLV